MVNNRHIEVRWVQKDNNISDLQMIKEEMIEMIGMIRMIEKIIIIIIKDKRNKYLLFNLFLVITK